MVKLAALLLASACCPSPAATAAFSKLDRQDEAVAIIWHQELAMDIESPAIEWVYGSRCGDLPGPALMVSGACAAGYFDGKVVHVIEMTASPVAGEPWGPFSSSGLAHEFVHAYLQITTGDSDGLHKAPIWDRLPDINAELRKNGL